jgi:predicted nucleotidyltransferase
MYVLNEGHLALPSLRELAGLRALLVDRLRTETGRWELPALHVSLFGSVASDGGDAESDVDLLVVRASGVSPEEMVWRTQIEALSESVFDWTGNHAGLTEVDSSDLERARDAGRSAWSSVMREGILLAGSSLRELTDRQRA